MHKHHKHRKHSHHAHAHTHAAPPAQETETATTTILRCESHREMIRRADDEDMFGDNIESCAAPDSPALLRQLKETV